jgi:pimeloyl-ACP methyl ester carboxylesterase
MTEWQSSFVHTNGIRMHYWRTGHGDKPPVVLSHGATDNGRCWTRVAQALEADYDLIMPDARGHGLSDKPDTEYGPRVSAADLAGLLRALELDRPQLVGHSMGGEITANCAADYPDLPAAAVIIDSGFISNDRPPMTQEEGDRRLEQARVRLNQIKRLSDEALEARCREEHPGWHEKEIEPWAESKQQVSAEYARFFVQEKRPWQQTLGAIKCPLLLLVGDPERDSHTAWDAAVQATGIWKEGTLIHIAGAGHNIQRDQFDTFMQRLNDWLAAHR